MYCIFLTHLTLKWYVSLIVDWKNVDNLKHVLFIQWGYQTECFIISPFEKWTYYAVAMSVRLPVRPSVRVFRIFLNRLGAIDFKLSIYIQ